MYRVGLLLGAALAAASDAPTDSDLRTRAAVETAWESLGTLYDTYEWAAGSNATRSLPVRGPARGATGEAAKAKYHKRNQTVARGNIAWTLGGDPHTDAHAYEILKTASSKTCLLYTSPSPRDQRGSRMPSSA